MIISKILRLVQAEIGTYIVIGFRGRVHLCHGVSYSRIFRRDTMQVSPLHVFAVHVQIIRTVGLAFALDFWELDSSEPFRQTIFIEIIIIR